MKKYISYILHIWVVCLTELKHGFLVLGFGRALDFTNLIIEIKDHKPNIIKKTVIFNGDFCYRKLLSLIILNWKYEGCTGVYTYNFNSNRFWMKIPHSGFPHEIKKDAPEYYQQNIQLLKEKEFITDIKLVRVD